METKNRMTIVMKTYTSIICIFKASIRKRSCKQNAPISCVSRDPGSAQNPLPDILGKFYAQVSGSYLTKAKLFRVYGIG